MRERVDKAIRTMTQYASDQDLKWPGKLETAAQVAARIPEVIGEERILELTASGFMPHWRIDDGEPLFRTQEVKDWVTRNLLYRHDGRSMPIELRVTMTPATSPAIDAPACIREIPGLLEIPMSYPCGVYFLTDGPEVVYVGQSIAPVTRISGHVSKGEKRFGRAYLVPVPATRLDAVEGALIRILRPRYNFPTTGIPESTEADLIEVHEFWPGVTAVVDIIAERKRVKDEAKIAAWRAERG